VSVLIVDIIEHYNLTSVPKLTCTNYGKYCAVYKDQCDFR